MSMFKDAYNSYGVQKSNFGDCDVGASDEGIDDEEGDEFMEEYGVEDFNEN